MTSEVFYNTFADTYRDDYRDSDNYHRILFNAARPVQARELTQSQTIIQKEIDRFGRNIFNDGASVNPIQNVYVDQHYAFVKLESVSTITEEVGTILSGGTSNFKAEIVRIEDATDTDPCTVYVQYTDGGGSLSSSLSGKAFIAGETLTSETTATTYTVQTTDTDEDPATGFGTLVSIGSGEFFILGHFVFYEGGTFLFSKYSDTPTGTVGFTATESIVTAADEEALYDNSGDNYNTTAPGADRYRIRLVIQDESDVDSDETFIWVARIDQGIIVRINNGREDYNRPYHMMAQRTYEESGNYAVVAPKAEFSRYVDSDDNFQLRVTDSILYIDGYRMEKEAHSINVPRPTTLASHEDEGIPVVYGNYLRVQDILGLPNVSTFERWNLLTADSAYDSATWIGTARIRAIEPIASTSDYYYYLFDVKMNGANNFRDARSLGLSTSKWANIVLERGNAVLQNKQENNLLFPLPYERPESVDSASWVSQRTYQTTSTGLGEANLTLTPNIGEAWTSHSDWLFTVDSSGALFTPTFDTVGATSITISGVPASSAFTVHAKVAKTGDASSYRTKTLTNTTVTTALESDGDGIPYLALGVEDIYQVDSASNADGVEVTERYYLDNGQRDNFYDHGRLILSPGVTATDSDITVTFSYFEHHTDGSYFSVESYKGQVDYKNIPTYRQVNGELIPLADYLDFRSTISDARDGFTGAGALVNELPQDTDLITANVDYYMPRRDLLVSDSKVGIYYIQGEPELVSPKYPVPPAGTMKLAKFSLRGNALNSEDTYREFINNRRYTMEDLRLLDEKVENVREYLTLSLLDIEAKNWSVLDENGLDRTKAGYLTDDFSDHSSTDIFNTEHRASIDIEATKMMPTFRPKNVELSFDSDHGDVSNTVLVSNMVMLSYTETEWQTQPYASRIHNVNPFTRLLYKGTMELSPHRDTWMEIRHKTKIVNSTHTTNANQVQEVERNAFNDAWAVNRTW